MNLFIQLIHALYIKHPYPFIIKSVFFLHFLQMIQYLHLKYTYYIQVQCLPQNVCSVILAVIGSSRGSVHKGFEEKGRQRRMMSEETTYCMQDTLPCDFIHIISTCTTKFAQKYPYLQGQMLKLTKVILQFCLPLDTSSDSNPLDFDLYASKIHVSQTYTNRLREFVPLGIKF